MIHYYLNLPKNETNIKFEYNFIKSMGQLSAARKSFEPFEIYLQNIIKVLEGKKTQAKWEKVKTKNTAQLIIIGELYEIPKETVINVQKNEIGYYKIIINEEDNPDLNEKLKYKVGNETGEISVSKEDFKNKLIKLPTTAEIFNKIIWGFTDVELKQAWNSFQKDEILKNGNSEEYTILSVNNNSLTLKGELKEGEKLFYKDNEIIYSINKKQDVSIKQDVIIRDEKYRRIIYSKQEINNLKEIKNFESFISDQDLLFEDGSSLDAERDGRNLLLNNDNDYGKTVTANKIKFRIDRLQKNNRESYRIRLIEIDDSGKEDENQTLSPLRYFFDDDITIYDNAEKKNFYNIVDGHETENTVILKKLNEKTYDFPKGDILTVEVNTYPLRKQLEAISTLKNMPAKAHALLIKLFEDRNDPNVIWTSPDNQLLNDDDWKVITDTKRNGCMEQRDFVNKALNTKDFAILEGPPGSGKTTVILELICQLAKQNKRVLLCGSTHVAIDNILERLKEKMPNSEKTFLEEFNILPVRIGDENRINNDIKNFQINKLIEENDINEDLLLDAANLVCGTTIGILKHPKFKKRKGSFFPDKKGKYRYSSDTPIIPEFDCLIIDESSKTTFQEFLVPALYAEKWILAGDVMQLSPYTERENIVSNIENLTVDGIPMHKNLQDAIFYLQKLKECIRYEENRFVLPVSAKTNEYIFTELTYENGRLNDFQDKILLFITDNTLKSDNNYILIRKFKNINFLEIAIADIIFVDENYLKDILPHLSERHAVLNNKNWENSVHAFIHNEYQKRCNFKYIERRGQEYRDSFEITKSINNYFLEKNWAEEVAWRIDREHQLRLINMSETSKLRKKPKMSYKEQIEELLPKSLDKDKVEDSINSVAEMSFPSILESLVQGIKGGRKTKIESVISEGFKPYDLEKRKTTLVYQHRMHPDISKFPREQFYSKKDENGNITEIALNDLENIEKSRDWNYKIYSSRSVWVNVDGETCRNYNKEEVNVLMEHLRKFINHVKNDPKDRKKEWSVACLTFYRGQEKLIREKLQALCKNENGFSSFKYHENDIVINIKLHTVDKFQGHEADVVFLSMVQTRRVGFLDNPNRLNVAITRAKYQLVVIGNRENFLRQNNSDDLKKMAKNMQVYNEVKE